MISAEIAPMGGEQRKETMDNTMEEERSIVQPVPWRMHEFFANSGLVYYGLQGIIHSITMPGALLIKKCKANFFAGCCPVIISVYERVKTAYDLVEDANLSRRVEIWDIPYFSFLLVHKQFTQPVRNALHQAF